ncbi:hypothetical protein BpHYR1_038859 [Brachionus plicatilis]|uniref:Secreted protein n=1 Tax=Brachionus plicatilis TaxID=10195 RepID=A0A3M7RQE9_BRAPC|nr:hypothetical protein BpHYR1_038859 [Brachionus plicatilis]
MMIFFLTLLCSIRITKFQSKRPCLIKIFTDVSANTERRHRTKKRFNILLLKNVKDWYYSSDTIAYQKSTCQIGTFFFTLYNQNLPLLTQI